MPTVNFENVKITTITVIFSLEGDVIIENVFPLLSITRLDLDRFSRSTKKFKIPWPGKKHAGSIFSAKFSNVTRGIIKTSTDNSFGNSIILDICTSNKNVSAKLAKGKIHLTGPNSLDLAKEAVEHIIGHLNYIQSELDYISDHIEERNKVIDWLIRETQGERFIINEETQEIIDLQEGEEIKDSVYYNKEGEMLFNYKEIPFKWELGDSVNDNNIVVNLRGRPYYRSLTKKEKKDGVTEYPIMVLGDQVKLKEGGKMFPVDNKGNKISKISKFPMKVLEVTSVKVPNIISDEIKFPPEIDSRIGTFLIQYIQDYAYHHILCDFFEEFKNISRVYRSPLTIGPPNIAMINYSYDLSMHIDRWALASLINGYEDFSASYNNTKDHHVSVTLYYERDNNESIKRKNSCHSWMIYKSGIVTQSGPSAELMAPAYYKFMKFIDSVRDQIRLDDGKPFKLKFRRTEQIEQIEQQLVAI